MKLTEKEIVLSSNRHKCLICNSEKRQKLMLFRETDLDNKKCYNLFKCKNCGLIRPLPLPYTEKNKIEIYDFKHEDIKIDFESLESKHGLKNFKPYIKFIKQYHIKGNTLDIGCGGGFLLYLTQEIGLISEGIELNNSLVNALNQKGFKVYNQELGNNIYQNKKYDLITANHVLEHIDDLNSFLQEVQKLLNSGGYFIFAIPYIYGIIPKIMRTKWYGQGYGKHLNFFSIKSIKKLFKNNNFKVIKIEKRSMDYTKHNMPKTLIKIINLILKIIIDLKCGDNLFVIVKTEN
ncbi:MAG: class I SAM-dependent methyltransferase [Nanoarchaeota archaeon]